MLRAVLILLTRVSDIDKGQLDIPRLCWFLYTALWLFRFARPILFPKFDQNLRRAAIAALTRCTYWLLRAALRATARWARPICFVICEMICAEGGVSFSSLYARPAEVDAARRTRTLRNKGRRESPMMVVGACVDHPELRRLSAATSYRSACACLDSAAQVPRQHNPLERSQTKPRFVRHRRTGYSSGGAVGLPWVSAHRASRRCLTLAGLVPAEDGEHHDFRDRVLLEAGMPLVYSAIMSCATLG